MEYGTTKQLQSENLKSLFLYIELQRYTLNILKPSGFFTYHQAVAYRGGGWVFKPPPKFRSFDKAAVEYKLRGKCLVFLFQHPN